MKKRGAKRRASPLRKKGWWIGGLILLAAAVWLGYRFGVAPVPKEAAAPPPAGAGSTADFAAAVNLTGRWLRSDGGYVLQISDVGRDGRMGASYFNPKSIHVSSARWHHQDGRLLIFVELRDVNYPGSTYTLGYDATDDRMRGIYYQAAMRQQFEVEFEREK